MNQFIYSRHGDVTIQSFDKIPQNFTDCKPNKVKKVILGLGEVTGHSHRVLPVGDAEIIIWSKDSKNDPEADEILFEIKNGCGILIHEEHHPIELKEGFHWRAMKRQYNPFTRAIERVRD